MANHKSAQKRIRQNERLRLHNRHIRSGMRTIIKRFRQAVEQGDKEAARAGFSQAEVTLRKAATKGVIPKQRASRVVGRLAKSLNGMA